MGVETSAVQIAVNVTDLNSGSVADQVVENLNKIGGAGSANFQTVRSSADITWETVRHGTQDASDGVDKVGHHALTSLDNVRLLRDDFGIHIPRAMERAIASSKVLSGLINGIGGALIGFGAIELGAHVFAAAIMGAKKLWDDQLSLNKAAADYAAEMAKAAHDDFGNTRSIETTTLRINEATEAIKRFHQQSQETAHTPAPLTWRSTLNFVAPGVGTGLEAYHNRSIAHDLEGQSIDAQRQMNELKLKRSPEQQHQSNLDSVELAHAADGRLRGEQKITAEKAKQHEIDKENMRFDANREGLYANYVADSNVHFTKGSKEQIAREKSDADLANVVAGNSGASTYGTKDKMADARADAELFNLRREQGHELEQMREQALEAGLRGTALYKAQESAAIEELKFKDMDSVSARNAVHAKFHAEELRRIQDETRETEKIERSASIAGMTGIGKIQGEGANRIADLNADDTLEPDQRARRVAAAQKDTNALITEQQHNFAEQVDSIVEESTGRQLGGYARIQAEASKAAASLQKEFDRSHELMDLAQPGAQDRLDQDTGQLGRGLGAIGAGADRQTAELNEKNNQETEQIEAAARVKLLSAEKQKTAAIQTELEERLQKYQEELKQQEISQDDYNRRVVAAQQQANAEMIEAATAAREKMAGEFNTLFKSMDHPLKALESLGDKVAAEAAASLVQRLQQRSQGGSPVADNGQTGGLPQGILSDVLGGFSFFHGQRNPSAPGVAVAPGAQSPSVHTASDKAFAITSATIHIGNAMISGAAGASARPEYAGTSIATPTPFGAPNAIDIGRGENGEKTGGTVAGLANAGPGYAGANAPGADAGAAVAAPGVPSAAPAYAGANAPGAAARFSVPGVGGGSTGLLTAAPFMASSPGATASTSAWTPGSSSAAGDSTSAASDYSSGSGSYATSFPGGGTSTIGGAGAGGGAAAPSSFTTGTGSAPPQRSLISGVLSDVGQGMNFFKQGASIFKGAGTAGQTIPGGANSQLAETQADPLAGQLDSDGNFVSDDAASSAPASNGGMLGGGGIGANAGGALSGALGMYSAVEGNGGVGGALQGGMSGLQLGMSLGGPIGAAIGAAAGAVIGAIGIGGREKARVYDLKNVRPKLTADKDGFEQGSMDYSSAYQDMQGMLGTSWAATKQMGPAAESYWGSTIKTEIQTAQAHLTAEAKAGRAQYTAQAAQYDVGADSIPHDGLAVIHEKERIIPSDQNERITRAIESHPGTMPAQPSNSGWTGDVHIHAIDTKGVKEFFDDNAHLMRGSLNDSYAGNSGGGLA